MTSRPSPASVRASILAVSLLGLGACGGGDDGETESNAFHVSTTPFGVEASTPVAIDAMWLAFLADEESSGAADLNGDTEVDDQVAVVVNLNTKFVSNTRVAARELAWLDGELYLVVDEILDERNWGGASEKTELVLLRWSEEAGSADFVDTLDRASDPAITVVGDTLFYASDATSVGASRSSLFAIDAAAPGIGREVPTRDSVEALSPRLIGEDDGLLFLALNETTESRDLNGDADTDDTILALLDGTGKAHDTGYDRYLRSTELAISSTSSPYRARLVEAGDWLLGFLVDEDSQGQTSLNLFDGTPPPSWKAGDCVDDLDADDRVLHVIEFANWDADPSTDPPINTGVVGSDRVLIVDDAVATISYEIDEGPAEGCSLNGDHDQDDRVLRWFRNNGAGPEKSEDRLLALDADLPGPAMAVAELDGVFVIQCDEAADDRDHDGSSETSRSLIAWLDPQATDPTWTFEHHDSNPWATATWMGELPGRTRLGVAYAESANAKDINADGDTADSIPTFVALRTDDDPRIVFEGWTFAVVPDRPGISLVTGWGFYRVDEAEHGKDLNGNGTMDDVLLVRSSFSGNHPSVLMGALNTLDRSAIDAEADGLSYGGAFLFDETISGTNLSGDSDSQDLVIRHFTFE
jgi:hypothetical protein